MAVAVAVVEAGRSLAQGLAREVPPFREQGQVEVAEVAGEGAAFVL